MLQHDTLLVNLVVVIPNFLACNSITTLNHPPLWTNSASSDLFRIRSAGYHAEPTPVERNKSYCNAAKETTAPTPPISLDIFGKRQTFHISVLNKKQDFPLYFMTFYHLSVTSIIHPLHKDISLLMKN